MSNEAVEKIRAELASQLTQKHAAKEEALRDEAEHVQAQNYLQLKLRRQLIDVSPFGANENVI